MCCVLSNKRLLKLINRRSGDEILKQFQILFIALTFFIKYPLVVVLCYKTNRTFSYQTSPCHTLLSKHLGCLKIPDISSSISKPSLKKEKRITLSFKTRLSVVSCVTADFFFFFSTWQYIGQGDLPERVRPKVDEGQSSAAGSRQHRLLQGRRQEVSQLVAIWKLTSEKFPPSFHGWKIHLCLEAGRFAVLLLLLPSPPSPFFFLLGLLL